MLCAEFVAAMDDDLGTPAAVAAIHDVVREGNKLLADGASDALRGNAASVRAMLDVLGLDPADPAYAASAGAADGKLSAAVDALVGGLLAERDAARAAQGLRGRRRDPRPHQGGGDRDRGHSQRTEVDRLMAGNSQRKGAIKKTGKGNPTAGSGGRVKRGLEGRGPTPKAKDRPNHKVHKEQAKAAKKAAARPKRRIAKGGDSEWVAGRNSVVEALRANMPVTGLYVAEGTERDGRLREAFSLAAERGLNLLEVPRNELDRLTAGAVHQGLAARVPAYEYAHPDDLLDAAAASGEPPLIVALDSVTDPRNLGAVVRSAVGLRRARRADPRASCRGHDRVGVEDVGRCRGPGAGGPGGQPGAPAEGLPGRGLHGDRPGRRR